MSQTVSMPLLHVVDEQCAIAAFALTFEGEQSQNDVVDKIQCILYDDIGAAGYFRLMPCEPALFTSSFVEGGNLEMEDTSPGGLDKVFEGSVESNSKFTRAYVLFCLRQSEDETMQSECIAFGRELNDFKQDQLLELQQLDISSAEDIDAAIKLMQL